ncbi:MAG TPA: Smr/MutS family protein [Candidatus Binataceae bacterium]|nr:Smr/MutS family protein [Candidatus Binataceae bacterium]
MARKRKQSRSRQEQPPSSKPVFHSPFKDLAKLVVRQKTATVVPHKRTPIPAAKPAVTPQKDDAALFREAIDGARPLPRAGITRIAVEPQVTVSIVTEEAEVLAELSDLVSGQRPFELTETEDYVEGMRTGIDPRLVTRLRRGEFALQGHIDLHGMVRDDAKVALADYILDSVRKGRRAVLIVHGRGLGSPGGHPVLKHSTAQWLSHGTISGYVLAFTTARPADGGAGAMYVLLRRERRREPFEVLTGTHRRD